MLVVTDAQIAERDLWERKLKLGEYSLADALILCLASGAPASPYLTARINAALEGYKDGAFTDLAEPFGMAMGKREKNAMARETWVSHVRFHVDEFCKQGLSKVDPTHYQDTAFHAAGKLLHRSPSQIFDTYYGR